MSDNIKYEGLCPEEIEGLVLLLSKRIRERFPYSGLTKVCDRLLEISRLTKKRSAWISKPIQSIRIGSWLLVGIIVAGLLTTLFSLTTPKTLLSVTEFVQLLEAGINDVVLIGAAIFFLLTFESRIKRSRALRAIHELRAVAHIIDMHQLNKDPQRLLTPGVQTASSPKTDLNAFELSRYLDYCSEMLSLTGKIAALYVQNFEDPVALASVNEIESLTTGLSRKIWQKLILLHSGKRHKH